MQNAKPALARATIAYRTMVNVWQQSI